MLAPWRIPLSRALHLHRSQPHSRYFQLATVQKNGYPSNRTVVFRGFLDNSNDIKIITDLKSQKIAELATQPWGEICWYFSKTREQFRISGIVTVIKEGETDQILAKLRQESWQNLSDVGRVQFAWPITGEVRNPNKNLFSPPIPDSDNPLSNFCLLLLKPQKVDHLELKGDPQNRYLYTLIHGEVWQEKNLNP
jgi:pyridoxamine 5'-phosphate oxidase